MFVGQSYVHREGFHCSLRHRWKARDREEYGVLDITNIREPTLFTKVKFRSSYDRNVSDYNSEEQLISGKI